MFKRTALAVAATLALGGTGLSAFAQSSQRIEITGSSIKRVDSETALPVTIIRREEIERTGAATVADLVEKVSVNNGGGYQTSAALGDAARPGFAGASMRALGSNNTLVLLNGRRLSIYAFDGGAVSLNDIPLEAVERIEILRDGASSTYGTDAIAGVINLITRQDYKGAMVTIKGTRPQHKGGGDMSAFGTIGIGDLAKDGWNVLANIGHTEIDSIKASDRPFAATSYVPVLGINRLSSNAYPAAVVTAAGLASPAGNLYNSGAGCLPPVSFGLTATDPRCRFDYAAVIDIVPESKRDSLYVRGTKQLNATTTLGAEFAAAKNKYLFRISPTPASEATTLAGDPVLLPTTSPYYPTAWLTANFPALLGQPLNLYYRSVEAGPRTNQVKSDQTRAVLSLDGVIGKWDYGIGLMDAKSKATESYVDGYLSEQRTIAEFATGVINPFAPNDAAGLAALQRAKILADTRIAKSGRTAIDAKISNSDLFKFGAGSVATAVGFEARRETFNDNPLAVLQTGDIIGGGGTQLPVNGSRNVKAVFGEIMVPIAKDIEATLSVRHDKYSDFGTTTNPKLSARWKLASNVAVRGSVGTGFRAPTLENLYSQATQTNTGGAYDDPLYDSIGYNGNPAYSRCNGTGGATAVFDGKYCNAQLTVAQSGNTALTPEKSEQFTLGLVFDVNKNISFTVDYFNILQKDLIGFVTADSKLVDYINNFDYATRTSTSTYGSQVAVKTDAVAGGTVIDRISALYENLGSQKTSGVDVSAKLRFPGLAVGNVSVNWDGTYLISQRVKDVGAAAYDPSVVGRYARNGATLRTKHRTEAILGRGGWEFSAAYNWQSSYLDASGTRDVAAFETLDLGVTFTQIKNLKIFGGIFNVTDHKPGASNQNDYFQVGYDPANTNPRGRAVQLGLEYKFF